MNLRRLPFAWAFAVIVMKLDETASGWSQVPRVSQKSADWVSGMDVRDQTPIYKPEKQKDVGATTMFLARTALACVVALTVMLVPMDGSEARQGRMGGLAQKVKPPQARQSSPARGGPFRPVARGVGFGAGLETTEDLRSIPREASSIGLRKQDQQVLEKEQKQNGEMFVAK